MRAHALPGLSASTVVLGPLRLGTSIWSTVDLQDQEVVATLCAYVGSHIGLHPDDVGQLAAIGLSLVEGRLVAAPAHVTTHEPVAIDEPATPDDPKPRRKR